MTRLEQAMVWAIEHHSGQKHTIGTPYIRHPFRVYEYLAERWSDDEDLLIAGLCHDAPEDSGEARVLIFELDRLFGPEVAKIVDLLTHAPDLDYPTYITRIHTVTDYYPVKLVLKAVRVKLADLHDNQNLGIQHPLPEPRQSKLTSRYYAAEDELGKAYIQLLKRVREGVHD
jgi:(p)ppGpp synthase/HD superfamily hydrolase